MTRRKLILLCLLLSCLKSFAQFTTVTGTVVDPHNVPYALGTITPTLVVPSGAGSPTLNGQPYQPPSGPVNLDKNGSFSFNVANNTMLLPAGTKWNFQVCSATGTVQPAIGTGPQCFSLAAPITISGSTQSISTQLNALALALTVPLGNSGCTPVGTNQIQYNNAGACAGIANVAPGSALVSQGVGVPPAQQQKLTYDLRDAHPPAAAFACDGVTYDTSAAIALVAAIAGNSANVQGASGTVCAMGDFVWPANINLDFSTGWQIKTPTDTTTTPGTATIDSTSGATANCKSDTTTPTCSMSVTAPANDTYVIACMRGFSSGVPVFTSNVSSDVVINLPGSSTSFSSITAGALVPSVIAGARTFTATFPANLTGACSAIPITGLGPTPYLDGASGICSNVSANSPYSCTASFTSGSFLLFWGGQNNTSETCTTAGGGFTLVPGAAGCSTNTASNLGVAYQNSAAGGSVTPTITFTPSPAGHFWSAQVIGLRPSTAVNVILGGIYNPFNRQIFQNATGSVGGIDFTGNLVPFHVYPEWWGAGYGASDSTNLAALQASEHGAYGTNRINGSGQQQYNKVWHWAQPYKINGELQLFHVLGVGPGSRAQLVCDPGASIAQDATNQRIFNMQSVAYWDEHNCTFSTNASQDATHPLVDDDFDGVTTAGDLAPQFTTFYNTTFNGNGTAAIGMLGAKSGGGAQFSNIYSVDNEMLGFTQACYQIGTPTHLATNALDIGYSGDMQACPNYGMVIYGGGYVSVSAGSNGISSMENNFLLQTGYDMAGSQMQGPCIMEHMRSESRKLISCGNVIVKDSRTQNQAQQVTPGVSFPVGSIMTGDYVTGDGAPYKVTVDGGPFGGVGTVTAPLQASSGTSTSITDTNQTVAGSVTIGSVGVANTELMTQAVSGSTGTRLNNPGNNATIAGTLTSGSFAFGDTAQQASTSVTCTVGANNTATVLNCSNFSAAPDSSHTWTDLTTTATFNPSATPVFAPSSPVMLITAATGTPDSTHDWVGGTTGLHYTPTALPANQANFTTNAFNGMFLGIPTGTSTNCKAVVTSNTATTINFTGGLSTVYPFTFCGAPDSTSTFNVSPGWSHSGTVTSGGMQLQYMNENVISGDILFDLGALGRIEDVIAPLGKVQLGAAETGNSSVKNLSLTRSDWYAAVSDPQQGYPLRHWSAITAFLPGGALPINWTYPAINGTPFTGALHADLGAEAQCFNAGTIGSALTPPNTSSNEVCAGGRSDRQAGTDTFRARYEVNAPIGAPALNNGQLNAAGTDTVIAGGSSTGTATPGSIQFAIGATGSSGSTPNTGSNRWRIDGATAHLFATTDNTNDIGASAANRPRNIFAGTGFTGPVYSTTTNCAQSGTAANPSVVSCSAAAAGAVACSVSASAGTCVVNTTAVGANSQIIVQETTKENTRLGVTCNTSPTVIPAIIVASQVNGTSFTINMPTISTNPACFDYWIVNQ